MADFAKYYPLLLASEGGYVFDPPDPGGETWRGIARACNPRWAGWRLLDAHKAQADWPANCRVYPRNKLATAVLQQDQALAGLVRSFYRAGYWDALGLGERANQGVAGQLCDIGVNSGTGRVGRLARYVLASSFGWPGALDGDLGPRTTTTRWWRPGARSTSTGPGTRPAGLVRVPRSAHLVPDAATRRYLPAWPGRVAAIPFVA